MAVKNTTKDRVRFQTKVLKGTVYKLVCQVKQTKTEELTIMNENLLKEKVTMVHHRCESK